MKYIKCSMEALRLHYAVPVHRFLASNSRRWWMAFSATAFLLVASQACAVNASGFITHIDSPEEFEIGKLHVVMNGQTKCEKMGIYSRTKSNLTLCNTLHFSIGSVVHLSGQTSNPRYFSATRVVVGMQRTRNNQRIERFGGQSKLILKRAALLEEEAKIYRGTEERHGNLSVDGYPITITPETTLRVTSDSKSAAFPSFSGKTPFPSRLLQPNIWVAYRSIISTNQTLVAKQLYCLPNHVYPSEKKFLRKFTPKIEVPDYGNHMPGNIQYKHGDAIKILPNEKLQEYVSKLGMEVVPQYQKKLEANDPTKIDFNFYVVYPFIHTGKSDLMEVNGGISGEYYNHVFTSHLVLNTPKPDSLVEDVIGMPEGTILIPDIVLSRLNSEGQLAALLSYAVTSIIQKQAYYAWSLGPQTTSLLLDFFSLGNLYKLLAYPQTEQQLRIGIRQMYLAGYDIREAPFAWAVAQGKPVNNPVIDSKHPDKEIPWYAAYAFNYISQYYKDVDYSKLKRGEAEYQAFLKELYKADPSLPHPKEAVSATSAAATK